MVTHWIKLKSWAIFLLLVIVFSTSLYSCSNTLEFSNPEAKIAFASTREGNRDIYVINLDGSGETRLTDDPAWDWNPAWSPDGNRIAFESNRDGDHEIFLMNADGTGLVQLTDNDHQDRAPSWSPGGSRIAFQQQRQGGGSDIYTMRADGSGVTRLADDDYDEIDPAWSPDGLWIAFSGEFGGQVIKSDGSDRDSVSSAYREHSLAWWPVGSYSSNRVAFNTDSSKGNRDIYVASVFNASGTRQLTDNMAHDASPAWSPDGQHIAFETNRDGNMEIYVMNADGSGVKRITDNSYADVLPSWQP